MVIGTLLLYNNDPSTVYKYLGVTKPACTSKSIDVEFHVYRDIKTNQLYYRLAEDFYNRMSVRETESDDALGDLLLTKKDDALVMATYLQSHMASCMVAALIHIERGSIGHAKCMLMALFDHTARDIVKHYAENDNMWLEEYTNKYMPNHLPLNERSTAIRTAWAEDVKKLESKDEK